MAYVIKKNAGVWWPVRWDEAADGGGVETAEIRVKFRRPGMAEAQEINEAAKAGLSMQKFGERVIMDWEGPATEAGPLQFSPAHLADMLDVPGFPVGLERAFWQMVAAVPDDRAKNLPGSPATGPQVGEPTADQTPGTPT